MRFGSIYLENYIGIYNGMGLSQIFIDFTRGTHKTIVIRGDNGSGKSTIMKSLSVFPDSNDCFIPEKPAKKEIILINGDILYRLSFIHGVKNNGQREVTKAYIFKTINGTEFPLNENGNVSSYKDLIYDELGLDPNFESLSQLSTDDRGIADKKPADRKRFVNSILNNLEVYNDIYKSLTKRSTSYKNLIGSISAKLGSIGDINVLLSNINGIDERINEAQDQKDQAIEGLASQKATMRLMDPDGTLEEFIKTTEEAFKDLQEKLDRAKTSITSARLNANISLTDNIATAINDTKAKINNLNVDNQIKRGQIESFLRERESEASELAEKLQRLQSFEQEWKYEDVCDKLACKYQEKKDIEEALSITGIADILAFSKDTYTIALNTLKNIAERVKGLKDAYDYEVLETVRNHYKTTGKVMDPLDTRALSISLDEINNQIASITNEINSISRDLETIKALESRPEGCVIDSCPYIKEAVSISKTDPRSRMTKASGTLEILKTKYKEISVELERYGKINLCSNDFRNLIRDIDTNKAIISKLPCGDIFADKQILIDSIFREDYQEAFNTIYSYIGLAAQFDYYKAIIESIKSLESEKAVYESKQDIVNDIQRAVDRINQRLSEIDGMVKPIQATLAANDTTIIKLNGTLSNLQVVADLEDNKAKIETEFNELKKTYEANLEKIKKFNGAQRIAVKYAESIESINARLNPLMQERDRLNHQMRLVDDYNRELEQLNGEYNLIETIRYYSSPTTGIQLTFMEMYMGNIIKVANDLLAMFFNGQFRILPFIINESEFRIPCAGEGIVNDDISSMSSAQIAMISMILSFSFLYSSSSKYNILKLDEIDGPLDSNNRIMFLDVLKNVMNMMGTEQCIMISHNTELQSEDCDMIILKTNDTLDYGNGNIIWKY